MDRRQRLIEGLSKVDRIIEIGPSHNPVVPKSEGWNTKIVDHASASTLRQKYAQQQVDRIEEVDIIWTGEELASLFEPNEIGTFDAIIASHVLEHLPNPVRFLISCQNLLKPNGVIKLALPDKRYCFDVLCPLSTTADFLLAFYNEDRTHTARTAFLEAAYAVSNDGKGSWTQDVAIGELTFVHTLATAYAVFERSRKSNDYFDFHAWRFVPASFELIMLELQAMGTIALNTTNVISWHGVEFFVDLTSSQEDGTQIELQRKRMTLARAAFEI